MNRRRHYPPNLRTVLAENMLLRQDADYETGIISEKQATRSLRRIREETGQRALLIDSLAGLMRVALRAGDLDEVATMLAGISGYLDERGIDGIEHYGRLFVTLVEASTALGDDASARRYLDQAMAFQTDRANGLSDPMHRASYLTNVPAHQRIAELANELGRE